MSKLNEVLTFIGDKCGTLRYIFGTFFAVGASLVAVKKYCAGGICTASTRLDGKTVIITGANCGIGKITALEVAKRGGRVILACRDITKAERAAQFIRNTSGSNNVVVKVIDLSSLKSVRKFSQEICAQETSVDYLVNNAGVMLCPEWQSDEGYELQFAVNHLGHFHLTNLLLDKMKKSPESRIITVSSRAHQRGSINFDNINLTGEYSAMKAYAQSKLANILFTRELQRRLEGVSGVSAFSIHPGVVNTELGRHLNVPQVLRWLLVPLMFLFLKTPEQGAQTSLHCLLEPNLQTLSGEYFVDCKLAKTSNQGRDMGAARKLWELSEKMVNDL